MLTRVSTLAIVAVVLLGCLAAPARSRLAPLATPMATARGNVPHVVYSTLLGGAAGNFDGASDVAVDANGNAIVVGQTESSDFPTRNALQDSLEGDSDAFVAKFAPDGTCLFSTFLGGDERDSASAVAVDSAGAIYVAGSTNSDNFPLVNAAQSTPGGSSDAFVTKLSADGSTIVYSTRLGGNGSDNVRDLAIDDMGRAYVTGEVEPITGTTATFPSVNEVQSGYGGGDSDAFVTVLSPSGNAFQFSSLLDGGIQGGDDRRGRERITSILVDSESGNIFLGGNTEFDENEPEAPFVCTLELPPGRASKARDPQLFFLVYLAYLTNGTFIPDEGTKLLIGILMGISTYRFRETPGGSSPAEIAAIISGFCDPGPSGGSCDEPAMLATFDSQARVTSTANLALLDEFFVDAGTLDRQEAVYIAGDINSDRLTTVNALQRDFGGGDDVVVAVLEPGTLNKAMVTFFGGDGFDSPTSIATDADGNIYVAGLTTLSTAFPTSPGALQTTPKGRNDAFLVKISPVGPFAEPPDFRLSFDPQTIPVTRGSKVSVPLAIERVGGFTGNVKITPPAQVPGFKSPKKKPTVPGNSTVLKFKIKADAPLGPTSFTFTGTDPDGRVRSATVTLDVQ